MASEEQRCFGVRAAERSADAALVLPQEANPLTPTRIPSRSTVSREEPRNSQRRHLRPFNEWQCASPTEDRPKIPGNRSSNPGLRVGDFFTAYNPEGRRRGGRFLCHPEGKVARSVPLSITRGSMLEPQRHFLLLNPWLNSAKTHSVLENPLISENLGSLLSKSVSEK